MGGMDSPSHSRGVNLSPFLRLFGDLSRDVLVRPLNRLAYCLACRVQLPSEVQLFIWSLLNFVGGSAPMDNITVQGPWSVMASTRRDPWFSCSLFRFGIALYYISQWVKIFHCFMLRRSGSSCFLSSFACNLSECLPKGSDSYYRYWQITHICSLPT